MKQFLSFSISMSESKYIYIYTHIHIHKTLDVNPGSSLCKTAISFVRNYSPFRKQVSFFLSCAQYQAVLLFFNYWSTIDLECCSNFSYMAKWISYIHILFYILFHYDFIIRYWIWFPALFSRNLFIQGHFLLLHSLQSLWLCFFLNNKVRGIITGGTHRLEFV